MEVECSNSRPPGDVELSGEEEAAAERFLENVNKWRAARELKQVHCGTRHLVQCTLYSVRVQAIAVSACITLPQLPRCSAVKFLMARKFNVDRALVLYQQHEIMR
jgi:hypothetical protein